jgi:hypothetical protein
VYTEGSIACERDISTDLTKGNLSQHTYAQRVIIILVLGVLTLPKDIIRAVLSLLWVFGQVM